LGLGGWVSGRGRAGGEGRAGVEAEAVAGARSMGQLFGRRRSAPRHRRRRRRTHRRRRRRRDACAADALGAVPTGVKGAERPPCGAEHRVLRRRAQSPAAPVPMPCPYALSLCPVPMFSPVPIPGPDPSPVYAQPCSELQAGNPTPRFFSGDNPVVVTTGVSGWVWMDACGMHGCGWMDADGRVCLT